MLTRHDEHVLCGVDRKCMNMKSESESESKSESHNKANLELRRRNAESGPGKKKGKVRDSGRGTRRSIREGLCIVQGP